MLRITPRPPSSWREMRKIQNFYYVYSYGEKICYRYYFLIGDRWNIFFLFVILYILYFVYFGYLCFPFSILLFFLYFFSFSFFRRLLLPFLFTYFYFYCFFFFFFFSFTRFSLSYDLYIFPHFSCLLSLSLFRTLSLIFILPFQSSHPSSGTGKH